jgi:SAM-dependent methyltransferase
MRSSQPLYDALAPGYEAHFEVPHRRAYDQLAWERVSTMLPASGPIVDAGCGVGRWARRLLGLGYEVIGVEQAPGMLAELRRRQLGAGFTLVSGSLETVDLAAGAAGMVVAMGSVQYAADPERAIARFAGWVRPGGVVAVLADSLVGLVLELLRAGRQEEALDRLASRRGVWAESGHEADLHLLDRARLETAFRDAGLEQVSVEGLLVSAAPLGRAGLTDRLLADWEGHLELERRLLAHPVLADVSKQLLAAGRRPGAGSGAARPRPAPPARR